MSCLTSLISFYDKVTHSMGKGKATDVVYPYLSKAFDPISHSILLEKLISHCLYRCTLCWIKNCLDSQAQGEVMNGITSSRSLVGSLRTQCWGLSCLVINDLRGSSAPSVSLKETPSWVGMLMCWRAGGQCRGIWRGWIHGSRPKVGGQVLGPTPGSQQPNVALCGLAVD